MEMPLDWPLTASNIYLCFIVATSVADGYGNSRALKFDKYGNFVKCWEIKGNGAVQFNLIHNIAVDSKNTVFVIDRDNISIQI